MSAFEQKEGVERLSRFGLVGLTDEEQDLQNVEANAVERNREAIARLFEKHGGRSKQRDGESIHDFRLRRVGEQSHAIKTFVAEAVASAAIPKAIKNGYAEYRESEAYEMDSSSQRAQRRKKIREVVARLHGLSFVPENAKPQHFKISHGQGEAQLAYSSLMITGSQGTGKSSALVGRTKVGPDGEIVGSERGALHAARGTTTVFAAPRKDKAEEAYLDFLANRESGDPVAILVRARDTANPSGAKGDKMCQVSLLVNDIAASGVGIRNSFCRECPFHEECAYLSQEAAIREASEGDAGVVLFTTHERAFQPLPANVSVDLLVFDEAPSGLGVESTFLQTNGIAEIKRPPLRRKAGESDSGYAEREFKVDQVWIQNVRTPLKEFKEVVQDWQRSAKQEFSEAKARADLARSVGGKVDMNINFTSNLLSALHFAGFTSDRLMDLSTSVRKAITDPDQDKVSEFAKTVGAGQMLSDVASRFESTRDQLSGYARNLQSVAQLLEILSSEMACFQREEKVRTDAVILGEYAHYRLPRSERIRLDAEGTIWFTWVKKNYHTNARVLHLDGSGDHAIAQRIFGEEMGHLNFFVPRQTNTILYTGRSFSSGALTGARGGNAVKDSAKFRAEIIGELKAIVAQHKIQPKELIVICPKKVESLIQADLEGAGIQHDHFNAIRGSNAYEDCKVIVNLGRELAPVTAVEDIARAFSVGQSGEMLLNGRYVETQTYVQTNETGQVRVKGWSHLDPWVQLTLGQQVEAEVSQSIDRVRATFAHKAVIMMSEVVPEGLLVDQAIRWEGRLTSEYAESKALNKNRFMPIGKGVAASLMPEEFRSVGGAARAIGRVMSNESIPLIEYIRGLDSFVGCRLSDNQLKGELLEFELQITHKKTKGRSSTYNALCVAEDAGEAEQLIKDFYETNSNAAEYNLLDVTARNRWVEVFVLPRGFDPEGWSMEHQKEIAIHQDYVRRDSLPEEAQDSAFIVEQQGPEMAPSEETPEEGCYWLYEVTSQVAGKEVKAVSLVGQTENGILALQKSEFTAKALAVAGHEDLSETEILEINIRARRKLVHRFETLSLAEEYLHPRLGEYDLILHDFGSWIQSETLRISEADDRSIQYPEVHQATMAGEDLAALTGYWSAIERQTELFEFEDAPLVSTDIDPDALGAPCERPIYRRTEAESSWEVFYAPLEDLDAQDEPQLTQEPSRTPSEVVCKYEEARKVFKAAYRASEGLESIIDPDGTLSVEQYEQELADLFSQQYSVVVKMMPTLAVAERWLASGPKHPDAIAELENRIDEYQQRLDAHEDYQREVRERLHSEIVDSIEAGLLVLPRAA